MTFHCFQFSTDFVFVNFKAKLFSLLPSSSSSSSSLFFFFLFLLLLFSLLLLLLLLLLLGSFLVSLLLLFFSSFFFNRLWGSGVLEVQFREPPNQNCVYTAHEEYCSAGQLQLGPLCVFA